MSLLDRIVESHSNPPGAVLPLEADGGLIGWVPCRFAPRLARFGGLFRVEAERVELLRSAIGFAALTAEVETALRLLYDEDRASFGTWSGERLPFPGRPGPQLFALERAAATALGVFGQGAHVNCFTRRDGVTRMWVARRPWDAFQSPGKLDQAAAGSVSNGRSARETLRDEAWDEASIPPELSDKAVAVGAVGFFQAGSEKVRHGANLCFDLELPPDFVPVNRDGEVAEFMLFDLTDLRALLEREAAFKWDAGLVVIDFLIRHGVIGHDYPGYLDIVSGLRGWSPSTGGR